MKNIDEVRGFEREIKFAAAGGYATGGGVPLSNCIVEVVGNDWQGHCPMLSLRFFHRPMPRHLAEQSAQAGRPLYDEDTPIGVAIDLGPEIAQSFIEQLQAKWPEFERARSEPDAPEPSE